MNFSSITAKTLAASLILASTTGLAFAKNYKGEANLKGEAPCPPPLMLKDGFYVGGQVGYDSYRIREGYTEGDLTASTVLNATGWVGGGFIGYGQYVTDMFYIGGEIYGNGSGAEVKSSFGDDSEASAYHKVQVNANYGVALIPGVRLNDTSLGYLRLGWNWANIKVTNNANSNDGDYHNSNTHTANGFDLGIGIETLVYDNWSVRTEYNHTWFSNYSAAEARYNVSDNQFLAGIVYHFA